MSQPSALKDLAVSDSGFIFNPNTGATFTVNPTGLAIVNLLREGQSIDAVVAKVAERFALTPPNVRDDVRDFLRALQQQGLVPVDHDCDEGTVQR